jgi:hypothetical protein
MSKEEQAIQQAHVEVVVIDSQQVKDGQYLHLYHEFKITQVNN